MEPKVPKKEPLKEDKRERPASDTNLYENAISTGRKASLATAIDEDESGYVTSTFCPPTPMTNDPKPGGAAISMGRRATLNTLIDEDESGYVTSSFCPPAPMTKNTKPDGAGPRRHTSTSALIDADPGYLTPMKTQEGLEEALYENTKRLRETTEIAGKEKMQADSKKKDDSGELGEGLYESTNFRGDNRRDQGNGFDTRGKTMTLGRLNDRSGADYRWGQALPPPREAGSMGIGEQSNVPYQKVDSLQHRRQENAIVQLTEKLESSHASFKKLLIFITVVLFLLFAAIAAGFCKLFLDQKQGVDEFNQTELSSDVTIIKNQVFANGNSAMDQFNNLSADLGLMEMYFNTCASGLNRSVEEHKRIVSIVESVKNQTRSDFKKLVDLETKVTNLTDHITDLNNITESLRNASFEYVKDFKKLEKFKIKKIGDHLYIKKTKTWTFSKASESCIAHGGYLALSAIKMKGTERREFYKAFYDSSESTSYCWVGLNNENGNWTWSDRTIFNHTLSDISLERLNNRNKCARLSSKEESIQASDCSQSRCYICEI